MLEIKNVSKTYTPKKGVPVKALDDVSLAFEDTGMVFILGKSGSGKSTLLNVLGGLDQADCGEFIIKGKSSNDFTQSDFDSYRNTFIGFIFQEYNILNEFTVAQNIALAMELQGKKATNEELNAILDEVDLTGYGNRKPNELSGGQKQRVAIARALIKHPEMIMADEPTGALDSNTGKQVFDTLKKLSKEKLVLIVSHDRDFAELYADRIIELKDGKILSDVSKKNIPPVSHSEGVSVVDDKIIQVKKGYKLTAKDLDLINEYISNASSDTLISVDAEKNDEIKKAVKLNDEGGKDAFLDTQDGDVTLKSYTPEDSKLIKSKLPFKNSFKIGASSLKAKPVRLVFTIFLCFVAFTLFGLADTMAAYKKTEAFVSSIADGQISTASFTKQVERDNSDGYLSTTELMLTDSDITEIKTKTGITALPVYGGTDRWSNGFSFSSLVNDGDALESPNGNSLYNAKISGYAELTTSFLTENGVEFVAGRLPNADNEIAIPKFIYDQFKLGGIITYNETTNTTTTVKSDAISGYDSIVGKSISHSSLSFPMIQKEVVNENDPHDKWTVSSEAILKIVGIYDTHFSTDPYADFMPDATPKESGMMDSLTSMQMIADRDYGMHAIVAVNRGMLKKIREYAASRYGNQTESVGVSVRDSGGDLFMVDNNHMGSGVERVVKLSQMDEVGEIIWTGGTAKTALAQGEIIVPYEFDWEKGSNNVDDDLISALEDELSVTISEEGKNKLKTMTYDSLRYGNSEVIAAIVTPPVSYIKAQITAQLGWSNDGPYNINGNSYATFDEFLASDDYNPYKEQIERDYANDLNNAYYEQPYAPGELSGKQITAAAKKVMYISMNHSNYSNSGNMEASAVSADLTVPYTVVGKYIPESDYSYAVCVSDEIYNLFSGVEKGYYSFAIGKLDYTNRAALESAVGFALTRNEQSCVYPMKNAATVILDYVGEMIEMLSEIFLYVGIGFAVFAALMMFNFISVSVTYKKREIGILRAVGARSSDVFSIFFNESMIITLINFVLSALATGVVCGVLNSVFRNYGLPITILTFGLRQIGLLLGLGVVVAFLGSFFPVMNIAKKRPIDAIQNR